MLIRQAMYDKNLSQADVIRSGVPRSTLYSLLAGTAGISQTSRVDTLKKLAPAIQVPREELKVAASPPQAS